VIHANPSQDGVTVNSLAGTDTITAAAMASGGPALTLNGGEDNDTITGGAGNDVVDGGRGNDQADLGAGDDRFVWDPGDGSDTVEGAAGNDTLDFHGSNVTENLAVAPNGARVRFTRDVGAVTMDLDAVETIDLASLAGADVLNVGDMTGTGLRAITEGEASTVGGTTPASGAHSVIVNGTSAADSVTIAGSATISGLTATVSIIHADPTTAALTIDGNAGPDTISAAATTAGGVPLTINGGDDADTITGGAGDDVVNGGRGNDVAMLGRRQRSVCLESGRRQRHRRRRPRDRPADVQRRERERELFDHGERGAGPAHARRREYHDGPQRHRGARPGDPRRRR
jgi:Ca2+-binding RTX toxin-like protein